ncbi:hypothetical protein NC651_014730 [Populus alba x Populus x berolinensis]|nr:hypothetical protein NC651_014730 [Populus alba x Populus x berolinensis]
MNQAKLYLITEEKKNYFSSTEIQNLKFRKPISPSFPSVLLYPSFSFSFLSKQKKITIESKKKTESKQIRVIKSLIVFFFFSYLKRGRRRKYMFLLRTKQRMIRAS